MNRAKTIIISIIAFFIVGISFQNDTVVASDIDGDKIEEYDLILSKGQSIQSRLVSLLHLSLADYSHIGMILKENGEIFVLHSTPDGTKQDGIRYDDMRSFIDLSNVFDYKILRYRNISSDLRQKLKTRSMEYKTHAIPFDYDFNNLDHNKIYCSELILLLFENSNLPASIKSKHNIDKPIYPHYFIGVNELIEIT